MAQAQEGYDLEGITEASHGAGRSFREGLVLDLIGGRGIEKKMDGGFFWVSFLVETMNGMFFFFVCFFVEKMNGCFFCCFQSV